MGQILTPKNIEVPLYALEKAFLGAMPETLHPLLALMCADHRKHDESHRKLTGLVRGLQRIMQSQQDNCEVCVKTNQIGAPGLPCPACALAQEIAERILFHRAV